MSITFSVESLPTGQFYAECEDTSWSAASSDRVEVAAQAVLHQAICEDCAAYSPWIREAMDVDLEVNMHNSGASRVLAAMGFSDFEESCCGSLDAQDALDRLAMARALVGVVAVAAAPSPVAEAFAAGGARLVNCDDPSDLDERLERVEVVAREALFLGRSLVWS